MNIKEELMNLLEDSYADLERAAEYNRNYLRRMYGIKFLGDKEQEVKKAEAVDAEKQKNKLQARRYLRDAEDIIGSFEDEKTKYRQEIERIQRQTETRLSTIIDEDKKEKLENQSKKLIVELEAKIRDSKNYYMDALRKLNNSLSYEAEEELENMGKERFGLRSLSLTEENLIFGNCIDNIKENIELEESLADAKTLSASQGHKNAAAQTATEVDTKYKKGLATASDANAAKMDAKEAERTHLEVKREIGTTENEKDPVSGVTVTEGFLAQRQLDNVNAQIEKENEQHKKKLDNLKKKKDRLLKNKKMAQAIDDQQDGTNQDTTQQITEEINKANPKTPSENVGSETTTNELEPANSKEIDDLNESENVAFKEYSKMLYNGTSGNALKYFITGEINNGNAKDVEIAKTMKADAAVQTCLKKIQFYLRKTRKGLSYEEYIDLKVQKSKFASLFNSAKKAYENKYKK